MKNLRIVCMVLLVFVAVNAVIAGYLFIVDPSGSRLGMTPELLHDSPFRNFLIPGIVLFSANGILNMLAVSGMVFHWRNYAGLVSMQGMILITWIFVQVIIIQELNLLHYIFAGIGFLLFSLGIRLQQLMINRRD